GDDFEPDWDLHPTSTFDCLRIVLHSTSSGLGVSRVAKRANTRLTPKCSEATARTYPKRTLSYNQHQTTRGAPVAGRGAQSERPRPSCPTAAPAAARCHAFRIERS